MQKSARPSRTQKRRSPRSAARAMSCCQEQSSNDDYSSGTLLCGVSPERMLFVAYQATKSDQLRGRESRFGLTTGNETKMAQGIDALQPGAEGAAQALEPQP